MGTHLPRTGIEPAFTAVVGEVVAVHDREGLPERRLKLDLPLADHAGGRGDAHVVDPTAQKHLAQHQPALMVLPNPTSSAFSRLTRGSRNA